MKKEDLKEEIEKKLDFDIQFHAKALGHAILNNLSYVIEQQQKEICIYTFLRKIVYDHFESKKTETLVGESDDSHN